MKEVKVNMVVDTSEAIKDVNKLKGGVEDVGTAASDSKKGFGSMAKGVKTVGNALKSAGIGLVITLVAGLTEAFSRNKKVMDGISLAMGTIQQVFSQVADAMINVYNSVTSASENFDALGKVISGLITLAFTPLKLAFYGTIAAAEGLKLAYENMFGDETSIAKAQANLDETNQQLKDISDDAIKAGKDVIKNTGEAITELGAIGETVVKEMSKVSISTAKATADANKNAEDAAVIATARIGGLLAKYERDAELQRQIRDDVSKSIEERQTANEKLAGILDDQEKALLKQADIVIAGAEAELQKNDSIENQAALIDAINAKEQVRSDIAGKRSEQLTNETALLMEQRDLQNAITDGIVDRNKKQKEFDAEQETDPLVKLESQRVALEAENEQILTDLQTKREMYAEGTAERLQAEEDYKNASQAITNDLTRNEIASELARRQAAYDSAAAKEQIQSGYLSFASQAIGALASLDSESKALQASTLIATAAAAVANQVMSTNVANLGALATPQAIATSGASALPVIAANTTMMKLGIASTGIALGVGLAKLGKSDSSPEAPEAAGFGGSNAPSFNLVEGSADNQIQNSINGQFDNAQPLRAFVVAQDVTSQQSLDRQIESNSGI